MCAFCDIIRHKADAKVVYETDKIIAFLDIDPISDGHVLVLPKIHVDSITKLSNDYLHEIMDIAKKIVQVFENKYEHRGYTIMQNGGECCDFGHFHLHVFPRIKDDGLGWKYPEYGGRYTDEIALDLKEKLTD